MCDEFSDSVKGVTTRTACDLTLFETGFTHCPLPLRELARADVLRKLATLTVGLTHLIYPLFNLDTVTNTATDSFD